MKTPMMSLVFGLLFSIPGFMQNPPSAAFTVNSGNACPGQTLSFTDQSSGSVLSWAWHFPGGNPSFANVPNPLIAYNTPGSYDVSLVVSNAWGSDSLLIPCYITVHPTPGAYIGPDLVICSGDTVVIHAPTAAGGAAELSTTMLGGNNHRGNMFDITALNDVIITGFEGNPMGPTNIIIYYKEGSYVGFETDPAAWTLVGTAVNVIPTGYGLPTPYPIPSSILIPAGSTFGFYISSTNTSVSVNYTDGISVGHVYSEDENIQIREGSGQEYPFGWNFLTPRVWNGMVHYTLANVYTYHWSNGSSANPLLVVPIDNTSYYLTVSDPYGCFNFDTVSVTVNPSPTPTVTWTGFLLHTQLGYDFYQWHHNGITINGANSNTYIPSTGGLYAVLVTASNGCTRTSSAYTLNVEGINEETLPGTFRIFPNPGDGQLLLSSGSIPGGNYWLRVFNLQGVMVFAQEIRLCQGNTHFPLNLSALRPGVYFIDILGKEPRKPVRYIRQ